jgi:uncharacterized protein
VPRWAASLFPLYWIGRSVVAVNIERMVMRDDGAGTVQDRLRAALLEAMKARDSVAVAALRSVLAALDNAEVVDAGRAPQSSVGHPGLAGSVSGLCAVEVERRSLSVAEMDALVRAEVAERHAVARDYERVGQRAHAERLRREAAVLSSYLDGRDTSAR